MGIMDRLGAARRYVWSPLTVVLLGRGSDAVMRAGQTGRVVVDVEGEDDGSAERIELTVTLDYKDRSWPLGEVPIIAGRHEAEVHIPADAPPSSAMTRYLIRGRLHRTKGVGSEGVSPVFVIGDPAHAYRAPEPQSGSDDPGLGVSLDADPVVLGATVSGRVTGTAERVEVGALIDAQYGYEDGTSKQNCWITWEAHAIAGKTTAWRRFVVLDLEGSTHIPEETSSIARLLT